MTSKLQAIVHENLDNAMGSGYFDKGMELYGASSEVIAEDMIMLCADLEDHAIEEIVPHVQSWWQKV